MTGESENPKTEPTEGTLEETLRQVDRLHILDDRKAEEILDYDERGLPR
jgi:hypothetical protein